MNQNLKPLPLNLDSKISKGDFYMLKLKEFIRFDSNAFFKGKHLVFKEGKYTSDENFKGCKMVLVIDQDETFYPGINEKGINRFETITIKVPDTDESYVKGFHCGEEVVVDNIVAKPYVSTINHFSSLNVSFTGRVRHMNEGNK